MIEINNGKFAVRLRPESEQDIEFIKCLNGNNPIGYVMSNNEFLVFRKYLPKIMESYNARKS